MTNQTELESILEDLSEMGELFPDLGTVDLVNPVQGSGSPDTTTERLETPLAQAAPNVSSPNKGSTTKISTETAPKSPDVVCKTRNAIAARENRLKKKKYLDDLEKSLAECRDENLMLRSRLQESEVKASSFEKECVYLRNVLANVDEVSELLRVVRATPLGGKMACPGLANNVKREANEKQHGPLSKVKRVADQSVGGICLHVMKGHISLEFCSQCNATSADYLLLQRGEKSQ